MKPTLDTILRQEVTAEASREAKKPAQSEGKRDIPGDPPDGLTEEPLTAADTSEIRATVVTRPDAASASVTSPSEANGEAQKVADGKENQDIPDVPPDASSVETFELFFGPDVAAMPLPIPVVIDAMPTRIGHNKNTPMRVTDFPANGAVGDPRPDLPGGAWWDAVLRSLFAMDGHEVAGLYERFHGLRGVDAVRLAPAAKGVRVVALDGETWGTVREWIVATMGKAATLDVVLKGVVVVGGGGGR